MRGEEGGRVGEEEEEESDSHLLLPRRSHVGQRALFYPHLTWEPQCPISHLYTHHMNRVQDMLHMLQGYRFQDMLQGSGHATGFELGRRLTSLDTKCLSSLCVQEDIYN